MTLNIDIGTVRNFSHYSLFVPVFALPWAWVRVPSHTISLVHADTIPANTYTQSGLTLRGPLYIMAEIPN